MSADTKPTAQDLVEKEMVECLLSDKQQDFSKLYDRYSVSLHGLIVKWTRDTETAENLLQDVFLKAWRGRHLYDPAKGRLFTWFFNIARNLCIDYLRSKAHKKAKVSILTDDLSLWLPAGLADSNNPDTIGLRKLLDTLSNEEKEVVELMYFKGYTQSEIAGIMNTPLGTVKTRMRRAMKNLRYYFKNDWREAMVHLAVK